MSDRQTRYDLIKLQQEFDKDDLNRLKYLTKDRIKRHKLSDLKSSLELFDRLEEVRAINVKNGEFGYLLEALLLMDKKKLIRSLNETPENVKWKYDGDKSNFTPLRRLFFTLGECMGKDECKKVKEYLKREHGIRKGTLEKANDSWQLLGLLEENLPSTDINTLDKIISFFDDSAVQEEFENFKKGESTEIRNVQSIEEESSRPVQVSSSDSEFPSTDAPRSIVNPGGSNQGRTIESYDIQQPAGLLIIINNKKFDDESMFPYRDGTDRDRDMLKETFSSFGFDVRVKENLSAREMKNCLFGYSRQDHTAYSALVVCILSHGDNGVVIGRDGKEVCIGDLLSFFKPHDCPSLLGKPKMFFIQACQGPLPQNVWLGAAPGADEAVSDVQRVRQGTYSQESRSSCTPTIPSDADFLLGMATVPNHLSYRSANGSFYIQSLTRNLMELSPREDLLSILTQVNKEVADMTAVCDRRMAKQIPEPRYTLRKKVYFRSVSQREEHRNFNPQSI